VKLGKYSCRMVVYVAEIGENCILGADFCLQIGMDEIFRSVILESLQEMKQEHFFVIKFLPLQREFRMSARNSSSEIFRK